MQKLWQKQDTQLNELIEQFETGDDLLFDERLLHYDLYGTAAHAKGLVKLGLLSQAELGEAVAGLKSLLALSELGPLLKFGDEDCHTKIEQYLTEQYGEVGKKIHTGRSRNDQVLTALRLYSKDQLFEVWQEALATAGAFLELAGMYTDVPMPGYSHLQKAMPTTVGMWASSFAEALLDDLKVLAAAVELVDRSPLGTGAGFGVPLELDREYTAGLMGFGAPIINPMYSQMSRGKVEAATLGALVSLLGTLNKFATDVLIYTSQEFSYLKVDDQLCTGSSIMPQKKNVDVAELLRAKAHVVQGNWLQIVGMSSNLPSGYNRDLQDSKKPLMESLATTLLSLKMAGVLVRGITPNEEVLAGAMAPEMLAAHKALELVAAGKSFREAYRMVGADLKSLETGDLPRILALSTHTGGTANLQLEWLSEALARSGERQSQLNKAHQTALAKLLNKE